MAHHRNVVMLMGPTGAGKSALALKLAHRSGGEVINADSRQIYRGMDIGTDKPTPQGRPEPMRRTSSKGKDSSASPQNDTALRDEPLLVAGIPHYLFDILTPDQRYSAAGFREDATRIIADIHRRGKLPIVVGGTGFYIRVLTGDRTLPAVPPNEKFRTWAETQPAAVLARELREHDPDLYAQVDNVKNKRRVIRALEIAKGRRRRRQASPIEQSPPWNILKLALLPPPDTLRHRIEARVDEQLRRGLLEEVRSLVSRYGEDAPGLKAVGYRQVFPFLRGDQTLDETRSAIIRAHWDYARRQYLWLKREPNLVPVASAEAERRVLNWIERNEKRERRP